MNFKIRKCEVCGKYTFKDSCGKCEKKTKQAGYKFLQYDPRKHKIEIN
tara:strand:- start:410 stop:553 length:144 start_codon:yes stop_codon:yes gene_type:complete